MAPRRLISYSVSDKCDHWNEIELPRYSTFRTVGNIGSHVCLWYECDPEDELVKRHIYVAASYSDLPEGLWVYLGTTTFWGGQRILHIYEGKEPDSNRDSNPDTLSGKCQDSVAIDCQCTCRQGGDENSCGHVWGVQMESTDLWIGETRTCVQCGMTQLAHDMCSVPGGLTSTP